MPAILNRLNEEELETRIELNYRRLSADSYYSIDEVFSPADYSWPGDKEGRALLAFVSHYKMGKGAIPCMEQMLCRLPEHLNSDGYLGQIDEHNIDEQQLSGHSWLLRGLCEHYELFGDDFSLDTLRRIAENLYLTKAGRFSTYPVQRDQKSSGGVSGEQVESMDGWVLSSDIGCAFMSIDGLSHVYAVTKDARIKDLLDEMISVYLAIDKASLNAQTHCTLTAARGMLRMYGMTQDEKYLNGALSIAKLYFEEGGMTETYQNMNWWGRTDSWTEPCAIVDSMMLAGELYKLIGNEKYRVLAARIYHNGLATSERDNGGAGTDSIVLDGVDYYLYEKMYEAPFCCTMRLAEGLWYVYSNRELFSYRTEGRLEKNGRIYADGDILYGELSGGGEEYAEKTVEIDGHIICPLVKYYKIPKEVMEKIRQRILF